MDIIRSSGIIIQPELVHMKSDVESYISVHLQKIKLDLLCVLS